MVEKRSQKKKQRGRPHSASKIADRLKKYGVFRVQDAKSLGLSKTSLIRLVSLEIIERVAPGLYLHSKSSLTGEQRDYVIACARFGSEAVIGGMTALFHHRLMEQVPHRVWVLVPYSQRASSPLYRCLRTKTNPREGVEDHGAYRITNLERTIVEAFRYSSKVGLRIAMRALRTAVSEKRTNLAKIHRQAKALGLESFIERYWETLIPESQAAA